MKYMHPYGALRCTVCFLIAGALPILADDDNVYVQRNLVSDLPGMAARTDPQLVNAWGIDYGPTGPWWVNSNGKGLSIVYDGNGAAFPAATPLVVTIPAPSGTGASAPTGIVFNPTGDFQIASGKPAIFLFATEDGTISGWNPGVQADAKIMVNNSPAAVYKGLAMGQVDGRNVLYAANFRNGTVDVFDASFHPISIGSQAFHDAQIPNGFAPFNVQNIGGSIFVTYAQQDDQKHDDVAGAGLGYVNRFTAGGALVMRLKHGPWMNSPWGVALAPADFGKLSGRLLVGNFGSGQIASFNTEGEFNGLMRGPRGHPVTIDGLWGIKFGNGATAGPVNVLFFAAGIQGEAHGLFGTLIQSDSNGDDGDRKHDGHQ